MKKDAHYKILKDIPLGDGKKIQKNTDLYRTHGVYYLDGGMLPPSFQEDFDTLVEQEEKNGWNYLAKIVEQIAFRNSKENV